MTNEERFGWYPRSIHWNAVFAGGFFALASWLFVLVLGTAIGGSAPSSLWMAIYTLVAPVIALYAGGMVAARSSGGVDRAGGALYGAVIWGFVMVIGSLLFGMFGPALLSVLGARATHAILWRTGYTWAIAGSIFASLIAAVLGASGASRQVSRARSAAAERSEVRT